MVTINFNKSFYDNEATHPAIAQISRPIGVRQMDELVLNRLSIEAQEAIHQLAPATWEINKRRLYDGDVRAVRNPKGGILKIGEGLEGSAISSAIKEFAGRLVKEWVSFCDELSKKPIDAVVLTGGGALIKIVRNALKAKIKENVGTKFHDLLEKPKKVRRWREGTWGWYDSETDIEKVQVENQELLRGGSAMGGCSLFFER